jgi:hypothetical protein
VPQRSVDEEEAALAAASSASSSSSASSASSSNQSQAAGSTSAAHEVSAEQHKAFAQILKQVVSATADDANDSSADLLSPQTVTATAASVGATVNVAATATGTGTSTASVATSSATGTATVATAAATATAATPTPAAIAAAELAFAAIERRALAHTTIQSLPANMRRRLELIAKIPFRAILTTNYDLLLCGATPFQVSMGHFMPLLCGCLCAWH